VNVTPTHSLSLTTIAAVILREAGRPLEFEVETPGLNFEYTGSNRRLVEVCGNFVFTPIEEGVRRLLVHYRRLDTIDRAILIDDDFRRRCITRPASVAVETPR
jgi:hypothetical protein